jgi:hypothetical protein
LSSQAFLNLVIAIFVAVFLAAVLRKGSWTPEAVSWKRLICAYLVGLVVMPACFILFNVVDEGVDVEVRLALAIGITLGLAALIAKAGGRPVRYPPVALFGFLGMLTFPLVALVFLSIACLGYSDCLHTQ